MYLASKIELSVVVGVCLAGCVLSPQALAHVPVFSDGSAISPETAILLEDPTISRVVYHEVTDGTQQLWITFEGQAGQQVPFQLGVPKIERLSEYRPALAVLGPGLPPVDLPFAVPAGVGGLILEAAPGAELEQFYEPFTGTDSWIVGRLEVTFPQDGRYYTVAYVPSGEPGKLWVAIGDREVFGPEDIASLPEDINRVRAFHEVSPSCIPCFAPVAGIIALAAGAVWLHRARLMHRRPRV